MKMLCFVLGAVWFLVSLPRPASAAELAQEDSVRKYRFLAKDAREKKDTQEALRYYAEYLKYRPDDPKAYFWVGELNFDRQDFPAARQAFSQALGLDSLHLNSNFRLYEVYSREGQPDSAAPFLDRVLALKPDDPSYLKDRPRLQLAELFRSQGKNAQALAYYLKEAQATAPDPSLIEDIARLYEETGEVAQALQWRQRLLVGQGGAGDQRATLESMVDLQVRAGDTKAALATLTQLAQMDTLNRYAYYSKYAQVAENAGNQAARLQGLEGMAQANSKDPDPPLKLAEIYLARGEARAADRWVERALRADPRNAYLFVLKGDCLAGQKLEDQAIAAYERAKNDPAWAATAQQRIWKLRPPESEEDKLKREFFGKGKTPGPEAPAKQ